MLSPSAKVFINSWNKSTFNSACVHGFIDGLTGEVYQTLPWNYKGWHGGGSCNSTHIGIEMCEPNCIKYTAGSTFTCSDLKKAQEIVTRTYNSAVELFAELCEKYKLDPLAKGVIVSHSEGYSLGIASNHGDPEHLWKQLQLPYTMNMFRTDVKKCIYKELDSIIYRVQVGAYKSKENAENMVKKLKNSGFDAIIVSSK